MSFQIACLAALVIAGPAAAQGGLTATPIPYNAGTGSSETPPLVLRNDTAQPITLDSLAFAREPGGNAFDVLGWNVEFRVLANGDSVAAEVFCHPFEDGACESIRGIFDGLMMPGETMPVRLRLYCLTCRGGAGGPISDTLRVFSGAGSLAVPITAEYPVAVEAPPARAALRLSPTLATTHVDIMGGPDWRARVLTVVDAFGRRVASAPGAPVRRLDVSGLAAGTYWVSDGVRVGRFMVVH
ncbi:hypothetical protein [Rubrivirga sp. IMCC43871]|uniref:hypothetical protein n=1 Tax=Rubrivirga sp. IMCC43871 TaxID=3391575 RepID=UPI00398FCEC5